MNFSYKSAPEPIKEVCDDSSVYRMLSVELDASNLPSGYMIPKLCPLKVDYKTKKATVLKRARVFSDLASNAVTLKVAKGHPFKVGDVIGNKEGGQAITQIDTSDALYDSIKIGTTLGAFEAGDVLCEVVAGDNDTFAEVDNANYLCYNRKVAVDKDGITPVGQAYMVQEANLIVPVTEDDKVTLTSRFNFI